MALRGTLTHRKTRRLAKELSIPIPCALGVMEALWHVTAEQAPTGAIGKLSNQDIADEMFWEGDADALISSCLEVGLLDKSAEHRLVVHDWESHADQATKRKLARHGLDMASQELDTHSTPESSIQSPVSRVQVSNGSAKADPRVAETIERFNAITGRSFTESGGQAKHIKGRLKEGATVDELKLVAEFKSHEWRDDPDMKKYLRPETVYARGHWEDYLGNAREWERGGKRKKGGGVQYDQV